MTIADTTIDDALGDGALDPVVNVAKRAESGVDQMKIDPVRCARQGLPLALPDLYVPFEDLGAVTDMTQLP